jgi:ABC-2 type transport system ATP-binding protein
MTEREPTDREAQTREAMIEAVDLCKHYGSFAAVDHLTFTIRRGEVVAFLGPNGAGKSTTMKVLTGYLAPTSGTARLCGIDVATDRVRAVEKLGYLPENGPLYPEMTPRELLQFFADARGMTALSFDERLKFVTEECALEELLDKPIGTCSKGQKQRVGMAQALLHDPEVLILDEPTTGLDPNQIRHVRELVKRLGKTRTILLSTHLFQEVEAMAGRVLLVNEGKLAFDGTPEQFKQKGHGKMDEAFHTLTGHG